MDKCYDIAVIGGGINGCGIAADAAMRGLKVILIEQADIASKTSSASSKLIHGGLRYLEQYNFSLVKKSLTERQRLLFIAPHLIYPQSFVIPYQKHLRPAWLLRAGLFLYDHLSKKNSLPSSRLIKRKENGYYFTPMVDTINKGFLFYDCATDDARLTISNAKQAHNHGAIIYTRSQIQSIQSSSEYWDVSIKRDETIIQCKAKVIINATGPWANQFNQQYNLPISHNLSLIQGSHIVVDQIYPESHAYLLQNSDRRIVFVIPFHHYSLIGTTDKVFNGSLDEIKISEEEIDYLLQLTGEYFKKSITRDHIKASWSGVRPLISSTNELPQELSRDYIISMHKMPLVNITVYGGKITTYRELAAEAINKLSYLFPNLSSSKTQEYCLPGGDNFIEYQQYAHNHYSWMKYSQLQRLLFTYGTDSEHILRDCKSIADLGYHFGQGLFEKEVNYLVSNEWAKTAEDIIWRRTKLALQLNVEECQILEKYLLNLPLNGKV